MVLIFFINTIAKPHVKILTILLWKFLISLVFPFVTASLFSKKIDKTENFDNYLNCDVINFCAMRNLLLKLLAGYTDYRDMMQQSILKHYVVSC